jgi:DNA helicase II / ATP-dependent DNA helicase PcrA
MRQILDLHIHSKYSRACSRDLSLANIDRTCRVKGVDIVATGDFTHPAWFKSIKEELEVNPTQPSPSQGEGKTPPNPPLRKGREKNPLLAKEGEGGGLFRLKTAKDDKIKFILSTEISLIYKDGDKTRRLHIVVHAPNLEAAGDLNAQLEKSGFNIKSDGRPILGMKAPDLVRLCLDIHPQFLIYPAHIWTPWYSVFGSKSGFDSMEECFKDETPNIYAIETGLSSDPEMNWRWSALDTLTIISNSDAHSLPNIGREANIFEMNEISYDEIYGIIKNKDVLDLRENFYRASARVSEALASSAGEAKASKPDLKVGRSGRKGIVGTIEFYPEEGMYHFDGHRACGVSFAPAETKKLKEICPVCRKPLVIGVSNRVEELADRPHFTEASRGKPDHAAPFYKLVELDKIIAETLGVKSRQSKQVQREYNRLTKEFGPELGILMDLDLKLLEKSVDKKIIEGIKRVREGRILIKPGFDGQYGEVRVFGEDDITGQVKLI